MKILIVIGGYFPGKKYGGPPVSVNNFCSLMDKYECYVVTRNRDAGEKEEYSLPVGEWVDRNNCKVMYLKDTEFNSETFENVITCINPDVIYLQGLFQRCVMPCLRLAKKHNKRVILAPRGELCKGAFRKKYKKVPYIIYLRVMGLLKKVRFQSTSDEETLMIMKMLGAHKDDVYNLTNIPSIPPKNYSVPSKIKGQLKIVFVSRIVWKKNLLAALNYLKDVDGWVEFNIYGSLEDELYWEKCKKAIAALPENITVNYNGSVSHDEIFEAFSNSHIFLFPTFSENYGHVIAEALTMGKPVIVSDQTPWRDLEANECGFDLSLDDEQSFIKAIQKYVDMDDMEYKQQSENALKYVNMKQNIEEIKKAYEEAFDDVL